MAHGGAWTPGGELDGASDDYDTMSVYEKIGGVSHLNGGWYGNTALLRGAASWLREFYTVEVLTSICKERAKNLPAERENMYPLPRWERIAIDSKNHNVVRIVLISPLKRSILINPDVIQSMQRSEAKLFH